MSLLGSIVDIFTGSKENKSANAHLAEIAGTEYDRGKMTDQESGQYSGSFDLGTLLKQIIQSQMGIGQAPAGYQTSEQQYQNQGDLAKQYYTTTMSDLKDPYASYESNLQPSLQASEDYINRAYAKKGLLRSGLPIEQMGRAGVELAIKEADKRMAYRSDALNRASSLETTAQGIGQTNLSNLANLYGQQQGYGLQAMGRQAGQAVSAANTQSPSYTNQAAQGLQLANKGYGNVGDDVGNVLAAIFGAA